MTRRRPLLLTVIVLLVAALLVAAWAAVGQQPSPMTFAPGSLLYSRNPNLYVAAADGSGERLLATATDSGPGAQHFAPDRRAVAFRRQTTAGAAEVVIMSADGHVLGAYPGDNETLFAWAPDSLRLAVLTTAPGTESAIIGLDGHVLAPITLPERWSMMDFDGHSGASWSPDGDWIAFTGCVAPADGGSCWRQDNRFLLVGADGSGYHWLMPEPEIDYSLAWSTDSRIALVRQCMVFDHPSPLFVRILASGDAKAGWRDDEWADCGEAQRAAWSPDGTRLVVLSTYWSENSGDDRLVVFDAGKTMMDLPDGGTWILESPMYSIGDVVWSTDHQVLFTGSEVPIDSNCCLGQSLWSVDAGGGTPVRLVPNVDPWFDVASGPQVR